MRKPQPRGSGPDDRRRADRESPGDDDGEPTGRPIPCPSYDAAFTVGTAMAERLMAAPRSAHEPVRAVIERQGRCREEHYSEPYARLAGGRLMPMGWNHSGPILPVGTTGTAEYVRTPNAGLWHFTPDEEQTA